MRKKIYLFVLISTGIMISSCSSDDDGTDAQVQENYLKVENVEKKLAYGFSTDFGASNENIFNIDLTFLTSEFTIDGNDFEGDGQGVYFEIYSSAPHKLAIGTYEYSDTEAALSFDDAWYFDNSGGPENEMEIEIVSGTITVVKSESDYYELTFNCVDTQGRKITGLYHGEVTYNVDVN